MQEVIYIQKGRADLYLDEMYKTRLVAWASSQASHFKALTPEKFMPLANDRTKIDKAQISNLLERYRAAGYDLPENKN